MSKSKIKKIRFKLSEPDPIFKQALVQAIRNFPKKEQLELKRIIHEWLDYSFNTVEVLTQVCHVIDEATKTTKKRKTKKND